MMKIYAKTAISEFLDDRIVYRGLSPYDPALPRLEQSQLACGLPPGEAPRKSDAAYGQIVAHVLRQARQLDAAHIPLRRLFFVGDTRLLDGTAFDNICLAGGWPGVAFICSENSAAPKTEIIASPGGQRLYLSNRWNALADFDRRCGEMGLPIDAHASVVIDMDKTILGARGRNAHVIDRARQQAVKETVAELLGSAYDPQFFARAYELLNQPEFHPFTTDNQDYLAYICLVLGGGLFDLEGMISRVRQGELTSFAQFLAEAETRRTELSPALQAIHDDIQRYVLAGDPTPFKAFRRNEYRVTVGRLGCLDDHQPLEALLQDEIVITQEVRSMALKWKKRGALLFGLSDKPDEASLPTPELDARGFRPVPGPPPPAVGGEIC